MAGRWESRTPGGRSSGRTCNLPDHAQVERTMMRRWSRGVRPRGGLIVPPEPAGWYAVAMLLGVCGIGGLLVGASMAGRPTSPLTWYLSRAAGLTLYALLWLALMTGLGVSLRLPRRTGVRSAIHSLHRFVVLLGFGLLTLHVMPLILDRSVPF